MLLLDEPVAGLSDRESSEFAHLVRRLADAWGMAVLVIEHDMSFVMSICDHNVALDALVEENKLACWVWRAGIAGMPALPHRHVVTGLI